MYLVVKEALFFLVQFAYYLELPVVFRSAVIALKSG